MNWEVGREGYVMPRQARPGRAGWHSEMPSEETPAKVPESPTLASLLPGRALPGDPVSGPFPVLASAVR